MELNAADVSTLNVFVKCDRQAQRNLIWSIPATAVAAYGAWLLWQLHPLWGPVGAGLVVLVAVLPLGIHAKDGLRALLYEDVSAAILAGRQPVVRAAASVTCVTGDFPYTVSVTVDHPSLRKHPYLHIRADDFGADVRLNLADQLSLLGFGTATAQPFKEIIALETATGRRSWHGDTFHNEPKHVVIEP
ncbi:hypothetical protein FB566_4470 [Stackebrandtia endophytica]|uniref:Uncharacterized protein n=1 Tax=Stackebrandtia endophytica TaxID=1496996 RepID=A0A543B209_9ACTN|nr:hypothetical protein [Stackebrandtia endophytica]TQL78875.1 hypothetical protein FB566_4470 [Stackebrandtia endophytica]